MKPSPSFRRSSYGSHKGFTLVEILIVVIILGILASIVIGQFTNVRGNTSDVALKDNLRWMRSAILLYQAEHGILPTQSNFEAQMTTFTDLAGNPSATKDTTYKYGAYMLRVPDLPIGAEKGHNGVTGAAFAAGFGWQYDQSAGTLRANCQDSEVDIDGKAYNTY